MNNPFESIETRLSNIEDILLEIKNKPKEAQDKLHTLHSLAKYAGVHYQTVRNWIVAGKIRTKQIGRRIYIEQSEFEKALREVKSLKYKR
jgi:excisionase family DNA binding protein